jgi:hypothetical protein
MNPAAFIISIRSRYLDQLRALVEEQRQNCVQGSPEVKFQIGEERAGFFEGFVASTLSTMTERSNLRNFGLIS